jgi:hypothetical protein
MSRAHRHRFLLGGGGGDQRGEVALVPEVLAEVFAVAKDRLLKLLAGG